MSVARTFLTNRFTLTFGTIAIVAALWNLYISFNDDGVLTGRIVAPDGVPVEGATVTLQERTLLVSRTRDETTTDEDGVFTFSGHRLHRIYLEARKDGLGKVPQREYRLYFKGQNLTLDEPLQLEASPS